MCVRVCVCVCVSMCVCLCVYVSVRLSVCVLKNASMMERARGMKNDHDVGCVCVLCVCFRQRLYVCESVKNEK